MRFIQAYEYNIYGSIYESICTEALSKIRAVGRNRGQGELPYHHSRFGQISYAYYNHGWQVMPSNISSVVEFQRWWVLKSKVFA